MKDLLLLAVAAALLWLMQACGPSHMYEIDNLTWPDPYEQQMENHKAKVDAWFDGTFHRYSGIAEGLSLTAADVVLSHKLKIEFDVAKTDETKTSLYLITKPDEGEVGFIFKF